MAKLYCTVQSEHQFCCWTSHDGWCACCASKNKSLAFYWEKNLLLSWREIQTTIAVVDPLIIWSLNHMLTLYIFIII